jgi:hypothetical protein
MIACTISGASSVSVRIRPKSVSVCFFPAEKDCFAEIASAIGAVQREIRVGSVG